MVKIKNYNDSYDFGGSYSFGITKLEGYFLMNLLLLFDGHPSEFEAYLQHLRKKCMEAGTEPPDYRLIFPVDLYCSEASAKVVLENSIQYDYGGTSAAGRWGGWRTRVFYSILRLCSWPLAVFGYKWPRAVRLNDGLDGSKSWHVVCVGVKHDRKNPLTGFEQR